MDIPIVDIDAYVNRSTATRRAECAYGEKPKKWLNPFQLYLKANRESAKNLAETSRQPNIISLVAKSWEMESDTLKAKYQAWGEIEKANHYIAHPPSVPLGPALPPMPEVNEPLSQTAIDMHMSLPDIRTFVNRPASVRFHEIVGTGRNRHSPRMANNSWILYLRAYRATAKAKYTQTSLRILHKVIAASWKIETAECKEKFADWARIESEGFYQAFPNLAKKAVARSSAKAKRNVDPEDEEVDEEDE